MRGPLPSPPFLVLTPRNSRFSFSYHRCVLWLLLSEYPPRRKHLNELGDRITRDERQLLLSSSLHPHLRFKSSCRSLCRGLLGFFFPWARVIPSKFFTGTPLWLAGPAQERAELAEAGNSLVSAGSTGWRPPRGSGEAGSAAAVLVTPRVPDAAQPAPSLGFSVLLSLLRTLSCSLLSLHS